MNAAISMAREVKKADAMTPMGMHVTVIDWTA